MTHEYLFILAAERNLLEVLLLLEPALLRPLLAGDVRSVKGFN